MAQHSKSVMSLEGVSKVYQMGEEKVYALNNINLDIHEGDLVSVLGPSGSGKSTLLNMLGLLDPPSSGRIFLDGIEIVHAARIFLLVSRSAHRIHQVFS